MNDKLAGIAAKAATDLCHLVKEGEDKILAAWSNAEEQAQLDDSKPKFRLSLSITLDLDKDTMDTDLSWSVKHHLSVTAPIPDTDQSELPIGGTVTIETPDHEPVTVSTEKFHKFCQGKA